MQSRAAKNAALDTVLPFPREPSRLYDLAQIEIAPALLLHRDALFRDNGRDEFRGRYIEAYERISGLRFDDWIGA